MEVNEKHQAPATLTLCKKPEHPFVTSVVEPKSLSGRDDKGKTRMFTWN